MIAPVFVDTNVLLYARDLAEPEKQRAAREWMTHLWQTRRGRLSFQVLQEFYVNTTAKLSPGLPAEAARREIRALCAWGPQPADARLLETAWLAADRFGFSFWDAMIVAAAQRQACRYLLTEDLQDGQDLGGVEVVDPFRRTPAEID